MISERMIQLASGGSAIRAMFEEGKRLADQFGAENVFDFSIGNPSFPPPDCVKDAIIDIMTNGDPMSVHGYPANAGFPEVREAVAKSLNRRFGTDYNAGNIIMTVGAAGGLNVILRVLCNPGDEVIVISPYFFEYNNYIGNADAKVVVVPAAAEEGFMPDLDAIGAAITPKTKAMILNNPNNPTGVIYPADMLEKLGALLEAKGREFGTVIYLISDEPYRELAYDGEEVPFIPAIYKDTIYCYSFSKTLSLPGERIGFLAIHPELTDYARVRAAIYGAGRALGYINASTMFQLVAAECVGQTADISVYKQNRDLIHTALLDMGYTCVKPSGAFYLFLKTPEPDATAFCKKAMALDLLVVPGDEFGCPGYVRLAYCVPKAMLERSLPHFRQLADQYGLKNNPAAADQRLPL